jgi:PAS domain-containing protein
LRLTRQEANRMAPLTNNRTDDLEKSMDALLSMEPPTIIEMPQYVSMWSSVMTGLMDQLRRSQKIAHERAEMMEKILAGTPSGIMLYRLDGTLVLCNDAAVTITGAKDQAQLYANNFHDLEFWQKVGLLTMAEDVFQTKERKQMKFQAVSSFGKELRIDIVIDFLDIRGGDHILLIFQEVER